MPLSHPSEGQYLHIDERPDCHLNLNTKKWVHLYKTKNFHRSHKTQKNFNDVSDFSSSPLEQWFCAKKRGVGKPFPR